MGPLFVIIFWAILLTIYGGIFLLFAGLWIFGRLTRRRWLQWVGGVPAVLQVLGGILVVGIVAVSFALAHQPPSMFHTVFREKPGEEIHHLQGKYRWFFDNATINLKFETSAEELERLRPERLEPQDNWSDLDLDHVLQGLTRNWEIPLHAGVQVFFRNEGSHLGYASEWELLVYDPDTQIAHYCYNGID